MKTLKEIYQANEELNYIDSSLYSRYRVKAGLRNGYSARFVPLASLGECH